MGTLEGLDGHGKETENGEKRCQLCNSVLSLLGFINKSDFRIKTLNLHKEYVKIRLQLIQVNF